MGHSFFRRTKFFEHSVFPNKIMGAEQSFPQLTKTPLDTIVAKVDILPDQDQLPPSSTVLKYYTRRRKWIVMGYVAKNDPSLKLAKILSTKGIIQQRFDNATYEECELRLFCVNFVARVEALAGKKIDQILGRRRLVSLPKVPGFQEPLYGHHAIQPSETSHAVGYVEVEEGTSLGELATDPAAASVLLGIVLVFLGALCLRRVRKGERRQERTSYDDNG